MIKCGVEWIWTPRPASTKHRARKAPARQGCDGIAAYILGGVGLARLIGTIDFFFIWGSNDVQKKRELTILAFSRLMDGRRLHLLHWLSSPTQMYSFIHSCFYHWLHPSEQNNVQPAARPPHTLMFTLLPPSAGCIQVSETTCNLLSLRHTFEDRGGVEVKGKVRVLTVCDTYGPPEKFTRLVTQYGVLCC